MIQLKLIGRFLHKTHNMKKLLGNLLLLSFFHVACNSLSFQLPDFFGSLSKVTPPKLAKSSIQEQKESILRQVSDTNNGKSATSEQQASILKLVRTLETEQPPPPDLLLNPDKAQRLINGTWFLQYTSPSQVLGDDNNAWKPQGDPTEGANIETKQFTARGSVSAAGVTVDTSNRRVEQIFDVAQQRVINRIFTDWGVITVGGSFRVSSNVPNRAVVAFDTAEIKVGTAVTVNLGFVFAIISLLRQSNESGWLETTFVDGDVRIGRGNKGTMFVLTRDTDAVQP